ncbi:MAG TPA: hypothetical protein VMV92_03575 [Streptosporangiaceae bacterium]|nr:hypothetical protein [Streptosporangiaceae bacterium]
MAGRLAEHPHCAGGFVPAQQAVVGDVAEAHPGLLVHDLDEWANRLRTAGFPVLSDDCFPGMRRFYSEDSLGNRLEFLAPLDH